MKESTRLGASYYQIHLASLYPAAVVCLGLMAMGVTYLLANADLDDGSKARGFLSTVGGFLILYFALHYWQGYSISKANSESRTASADLDEALRALEEAQEFFAGSLRTSDTFRLIASRVGKVVPYRTLALYLLNGPRENFFIVEVDGIDASHRRGYTAERGEGIIGRCVRSRSVEIDSRSRSSRPVAAIPLLNGTDVFGVLHLDLEMNVETARLDLSALEAIGVRSAALVLSGLGFDRSQANALTDSTTDLPNERAFYLILENQVAESQRKGAMRPLAMLSLDIRSFDDVNSNFGHAAGDRVLNFAARVIQESLRQMDFFARSGADEFLIVLPTASKDVAHDVIARIHTAFLGRTLKVAGTADIEIELNIGWAAFGMDGETPGSLLRVARSRKDQAKSTGPQKVLWFPSEYSA